MRCPNCGAEMIQVFGEWVCPECEYHGNKNPEEGTYR